MGAKDNQWFAKQIREGGLLYQNQQKSRSWASSVGLYLPAGGTLSSTTGHTINTKADLVKLRREFLTLPEHPGLSRAGR
ncbi:MAG: hypothetical protein LBV15_06230, partial [Planctomycetota bacterium]|nr:hypothetical protein [Planctomycetota bacterium]